MHIALLGDSILDNHLYTNGEPDVANHLRSLLPAAVEVSLCAVDGSTTADINSQIRTVPTSATHVVVSVGGNDALMNIDLIKTPVRSTTEALLLFHARISEFERSYRRAIENVLSLGRRTVICTIYNGNLDPPERDPALMLLMMFNDVILRCGFERHLSVIDLRLICNQTSDYANPIEPSGSGGLKIAKAIASWLESGEIAEVARVRTA
jgi:GDSL-like lipase/acylhydrolase family protein